MILYSITVFLSAFLLFQVQPIIAKAILPWFGGSSAVWSTCMLFFQTVLLLGYLYAHWLHERLEARTQAAVHTALLLASLAVLPILPGLSWKPQGVENPSWRILGLLTATVGLPYFLLSTTSPLLQAWFARTHKGVVPYRLFALSNLASMLALLSYPPLVEPHLSTRLQGQLWSVAYGGFALLCAAIAWSRHNGAPAGPAELSDAEPPEPPGWASRLLWLALAACASTLLLAVTNHLTRDVAPIPFLWILPLSVYLLSFIVCFEAPWLYRRAVYLPLLFVSLGGIANFLWFYGFRMKIVPTVSFFIAALFVCCMVCHGELARLKPHPRYLTIFYVMVSLGGAAGGLFVGLLAPNLFNAYYEFPIGLALCAALAVTMLWRHLAGAPWRIGGLAALLLGYLVFLGVVLHDDTSGYHVVARNFYGQLAVSDEGEYGEAEARRKLVHGVINHGQQMRNDYYRTQPVSYFCPPTGIGRILRARKEGVPIRVGILGLGCGTLAAYGKAGDTFRIYEINPLVLRLARTQFTYLRDTPAKVEVALGDARLTLEREPSQQFDLLVMDAFSGDSVPVHLITREAFQTYFRHLKPGGVLAVNISNKYLNLKPVMERGASQFGKIALLFDYTPGEDEEDRCFACSWVLIMDPATREAVPELRQAGEVLAPGGKFRAWTDDYSSLSGILR